MGLRIGWASLKEKTTTGNMQLGQNSMDPAGSLTFEDSAANYWVTLSSAKIKVLDFSIRPKI